MRDETEIILGEIFGANTGYTKADEEAVRTSPDYANMKAFARMLAEEPTEEETQRFVTANPHFLMGLYGWGDDSVLAFLTKPSIGQRFRADFAILQYGQGGCFIHLVELEPSTERLFTQKGLKAQRHNMALAQCADWAAWFHPNRFTFVRDILESVRRLPLFPDRSANGSFRCKEYESIESSWRGFSGFDDPIIDCTIVIGRWSQLSDEEKKRLLSQNRHDDKLAKVLTYEQLARSAFERPFRRF